MADIIKVGLDFGTHQTKICIKTYPNEDVQHPIFEFFKFKDLEGKDSYFLPSEAQINSDGTLSYGFINSPKEKVYTKSDIDNKDDVTTWDISEKVAELYLKYKTPQSTYDDLSVLISMLNAYKEKKKINRPSLEPLLIIEDDNFFRYFKQATFSEREWNKKISCEILSIWYLSYVIFLLEEKYGANFSINMGIPVGEKSFKDKKMYATTILLSAYHLVEDVYGNNLQAFLDEKVDELIKKTEKIFSTEQLKDEYNINIFPEAFACLNTLTSAGKLSNGMSLIADIGGGTTDISFFTIDQNKPLIYRYWSMPKGLNYIAEKSGFSYKQGTLSQKAKKEILNEFYQEEKNIIAKLIADLIKQLSQETDIPKSNLLNALKNRIIVYNGGGSTEEKLINPISYFNDVKLVDSNMWKETNMTDKSEVSKLCPLLTTAYGLSLSESDDEVNVSKFSLLFRGLGISPDEKKEIEFIDKDKC